MALQATPEERFRTELRTVLDRCRQLSRKRELTVHSNGRRILVNPSLQEATVVEFVEATRPGYVHVTNLGRPDEAARIRWVSLRFGSVRRMINTFLGIVCTCLPSSTLKNRLYRLMGMDIGEGVEISQGAFIDPFSPRLVTVGEGTVIGAFAKIFTHTYRGQGRMLFGPVIVGRDCVVSGTATLGPCVIEDKVTVLPGVVTMPFVHLKAGAVVGLRVQLHELHGVIGDLPDS